MSTNVAKTCLGLALLLCLHLPLQAKAISAPLEEVRASLYDLNSWHFHPDPTGKSDQWARPKFDDSHWPIISAEKSWQEQGFPRFHGTGWYRARVEIPAQWRGSKIILRSEGVREEYDVYVNGKYIRHFGGVKLPVGNVPTQLILDPYFEYGKSNLIALKINDHGGAGGVHRRMQLRRVPPLEKFRGWLPEPIVDAHPDLIDLYWQSWRMAWEKLSFGNSLNGFAPAYMEEGYDELIYQWDSIFMSMYGRYGRRLFPAMGALDNFYLKQEPNGYIQRIYSKTTGRKVLEPGATYTVTNPPLFAWAEWDYFRITGDSSRLNRVLPILENYDHWLDLHQRSSIVPGMFWQTGFDSGMDNMPRPQADMAGWVDETLQQVLAAKYLALISEQVGESVKARSWKKTFIQRRDDVNKTAWSERDGIYYDVDSGMRFTGVKHLGAFWSLLSDTADDVQASRLVTHLRDPKEFFRPHLFPALAASDSSYSPTASYWRGGVWAPTNYMVIRGLDHRGFSDFAREAALNHLKNMSAVYSAHLNIGRIDPNETGDSLHTIWECYNPEQAIPCTRADAYYFGRQDFAGWTALGPITLLIEQVIGLEIIGSENRVVWRLNETQRVGLKNFDLGSDNLVSLIADPKNATNRRLHVHCQKPFSLDVEIADSVYRFTVPAGTSDYLLAAH